MTLRETIDKIESIRASEKELIDTLNSLREQRNELLRSTSFRPPPTYDNPLAQDVSALSEVDRLVSLGIQRDEAITLVDRMVTYAQEQTKP